MDKKENRYGKENRELMIETECIGNVPVKEMIKAYILERRQNKADGAAGAPKEGC